MKLRRIKIWTEASDGPLPPEFFTKASELGFFYLASPYSDPNPEVMHRRALQVQAIDVDLMRNNIITYCPIGSCHDKAQRHSLPTDHEFWDRMNRAFISKSVGMIICCLPFWEESKGVAHEVTLSRQYGIPIYFLTAMFDD